jgi:hypothetical protein
MRQKRTEARIICLRRASCRCQCQFKKLRRESFATKRFGVNESWLEHRDTARGQAFARRTDSAHLAAEVRVGTPSFP